MSHDAKVALKVIGIGSPFGGDAVGFEAIERLRKERDRFPAKMELLSLDRPGSGLVPLLENAKTVVLIDAMQSGQLPGTVQRLQLDDLLTQANPPSSHSLGVAEALALAKTLEILPEKLLIYGVEADENQLVTSWYAELLRLLDEDISG
jgi:hydrogenase maturation protease